MNYITLVSFTLPENAWKVGSSVQVAAKQICAGEEVIDSVKNSILKMNKTTLSTIVFGRTSRESAFDLVPEIRQ